MHVEWVDPISKTARRLRQAGIGYLVQKELLLRGKIHGCYRMCWGEQIIARGRERRRHPRQA